MPNYPASTWFDRTFARLGLPGWAGMIFLSLVPLPVLLAVGSVLGYTLSGMSPASAVTMTTSTLPFIVFFTFLASFGAMFLTRYMNRRVDTLRGYTDHLSGDAPPLQLASQYMLSGVLLSWALLLAVFTPIFYAFPIYSFDYFLLTLPAWYYFILFPSTFIWTFCYAMFAISKMGKQPLELKPFTEDRSLGLRRFGMESLRFTGIYLLFVSTVTGVILVSAPIPFQISIVVLLAFSLGGIALFLLPLLSLHHKLVAFKREKEGWIGARYTRLLAQLERDAEASREEKMLLASDLSAIDKVQRDIGQIRTWPFDIGIIARLVTITLLPVIVGVVGQFVLHFLQL